MFLIFEDDIYVDASEDEIGSYLSTVQRMPWDVAYLGYIKPKFLSSDVPVRSNLLRIADMTLTTHAYLIHRRGAEKLLRYAVPIVDQIDSYMSYMTEKGVRTYRPACCARETVPREVLGSTDRDPPRPPQPAEQPHVDHRPRLAHPLPVLAPENDFGIGSTDRFCMKEFYERIEDQGVESICRRLRAPDETISWRKPPTTISSTTSSSASPPRNSRNVWSPAVLEEMFWRLPPTDLLTSFHYVSYADLPALFSPSFIREGWRSSRIRSSFGVWRNTPTRSRRFCALRPSGRRRGD
jgi:hypothetical protein